MYTHVVPMTDVLHSLDIQPGRPAKHERQSRESTKSLTAAYGISIPVEDRGQDCPSRIFQYAL